MHLLVFFENGSKLSTPVPLSLLSRVSDAWNSELNVGLNLRHLAQTMLDMFPFNELFNSREAAP